MPKKPTPEEVNAYNREHYERISLFVPKGEKAGLKRYAKERGESLNGFINRAIREAMDGHKKEAGD